MSLHLTLNDAQRGFADSPEGKVHIAREKYIHRLRNQSRGPHAEPWGDADEFAAIRSGMTAAARSGVQTHRDSTTGLQDLANAEAQAATARAMMIDNLTNPKK